MLLPERTPGVYNTASLVWQDREIRFDSRVEMLDLRKGEHEIDSINSVEDTKGNNGARGALVVTNLRLIWFSHATKAVNLSVGLNTIVTINIRKAKSKLRGHTQALCVIAKFSSRFEFIFTSLVKNSPRLFTTVQAVMRAYESTKLYRELKLRGSIMKDGEVMLLPLEQVYNKYDGVWNLSSEQGNLGTFHFSNVRVIWYANLAANFNVSLPFMQIKSISIRSSKFGKALVIETYARAGGYILGFKIDPEERLHEVFNELKSLNAVHSRQPVFGIEFSLEETTNTEDVLKPRVQDDLEIIEDTEDQAAMAAYYAGEETGEEGKEEEGEKIVVDPKLGLAIERTVKNISTESLFRIL